jgi:CheY-like chemotaxis protein
MRILVVEDEPVVAEVLADAIKAAGYEALVALDGAEALDVLAATPVDGVFMDLVMPGLSGLTVLAQIRQRHPLLPVVEKPTALAQLTEILSKLRSGG